MIPATRIDASNKSTNKPGPVNAPKAPANFQSPAPRLRNSTNGNSNARPNAAPSREAFSPSQPLKTAFARTPTSNAGTVSQFGIRRHRRSVHPAAAARIMAPASTTGFNWASSWAGKGTVLARSFHDIEKDPSSYFEVPSRFPALSSEEGSRRTSETRASLQARSLRLRSGQALHF